jgi:hypothetical protein
MCQSILTTFVGLSDIGIPQTSKKFCAIRCLGWVAPEDAAVFAPVPIQSQIIFSEYN